MTRPRPVRSRYGTQALTVSMQPFTFVAKIESMSSSVMSASLTSGKMPAFAQTTSMPPNRAAVSAATRSQSAALPTSPLT